MKRLAPVTLAALMPFFACDAGSSGDEDTETGESSACAEDDRGMTYAAGMSISTPSGAHSLVLVDASPAPPVRSLNDWSLRLEDATGAPVDGASITLTTWMPDHGHGSANPDTQLVAGEGPGAWQLSDLDLFMAGFWEVHFDIEAGEGEPERVTFGFCVD